MNELELAVYKECCNLHVHAYAQVLIPVKENLRIQTENSACEAACGELCFIPAGVPHRCSLNRKMQIFNFPEGIPGEDGPEEEGAEEEKLRKKDDGIILRPLICPFSPSLMKLAGLIREETRQNADGNNVRCLYRYLYTKLTQDRYCLHPCQNTAVL